MLEDKIQILTKGLLEVSRETEIEKQTRLENGRSFVSNYFVTISEASSKKHSKSLDKNERAQSMTRNYLSRLPVSIKELDRAREIGGKSNLDRLFTKTSYIFVRQFRT